MIRVVRLNILFLIFALITFSSVGQDILHLRSGGEKRIIFDAEDANSLTYRDYDDPDFKLVTERKKLYSKVVLANGKTIWLTQRDNYFRCRLGMNIGRVITLGDFASRDPSNTNAGFAENGLQGSINIDVNMYKFVDLRAMVFYSASTGSNNDWNALGFAVGPEFYIKLSPRFYASIPVLFQMASMGTESHYTSVSPYTVSGDGTATGFVTGLGLHARLGQHMAIGLTSQYFKQNVTMNFSQHYPGNSITVNYDGKYKWNYLSNAVTFTVHF